MARLHVRPGRLSAMLVLLFASAVAGCGQKPPDPVEPLLAQETLVRVLDGWKAGLQPADFQKQTPPVVVQDMEWQEGAKLVSYETLAAGMPVDANLHCNVRLVLAAADGTESTKTVTYMVGTHPVLTVFRKLF